MTAWDFQVTVFLNDGLADPQGKAIEDSLPAMGWTGVSNVRVGKHFHLTIDAPSYQEAEERATEVARRVLTNPVIESFWVQGVERE